MKIRLNLFIAALLLLFSASSYAWWGNNNWGNNGWRGWNPYPVWTPMYWAEEIFDNNDYAPYGYPGYGGYPAYGYGGYPGYGNYPAYNYGGYPGYGNYAYPAQWNGPGRGW